MPDELTPNYEMYLPTDNDSMTEPDRFLSDTWDVIEAAANPPIEPTSTLPQAGDYKVGDRVFCSHTNYTSSFLLYSRDPNWGFVWRPVQAAISPWTNVPNTAFLDTDYQSEVARPLQFALDNKGNCYWRGVIQKKVAGLPDAESKEILYNLPDGLRHHASGMYSLAVEEVTEEDTPGIGAFKGARWYIQFDGYNSFRFHNAEEAEFVHMTGIEYCCSNNVYLNP